MACGQPPWKRWPIRLQRMEEPAWSLDRKSTRLNSSHLVISYAVFCLKKKKQNDSSIVHAYNITVLKSSIYPHAHHIPQLSPRLASLLSFRHCSRHVQPCQRPLSTHVS